MWRPKEGWDSEKVADTEIKRQAEFGYSPAAEDLVEAGADAMHGAVVKWLEDIGRTRQQNFGQRRSYRFVISYKDWQAFTKP